MGLFSFLGFGKTKTPLLETGYVPENAYDESSSMRNDDRKVIKPDFNEMNLKVYPSKGENGIEYVVELHNSDYVIPFGSILDSNKYRNIFSELESLIKPLQQPMTEKIFNKKKDNVLDKLQKVSNREFKLEPAAIDYITNYKPESFLNYDEMENLPKKIDLEKITPKQAEKYGKLAKRRLEILESINTPDDAYEDIDNLVEFMQEQDNTPENPVVEANQQSCKDGTSLNFDTVIKISKKMENTKSKGSKLYNEDGVLYSAYLKIEERRIWKQMQNSLLEYSKEHEGIMPIYNLTETIKEKENIATPTKGNVSFDIFQHIINEVNELNNSTKKSYSLNIENYVKNVLMSDSKLSNAIESKCQDMEGKDDILEYLDARKMCLGQLSKSSQKESLREFVADTDFKDPDNTETKKFLLIVAKSEKQYIQENYDKLIEEYEKNNSKTKENNFLDDIKVDVSANKIENVKKNINEIDVEKE